MAPRSKSTSVSGATDRPVLQWVMAAIGGLVTLSVIGVVLWEALQPASPPELHARIVDITPATTGFTVRVEITNDGSDTAAGVTVVGQPDAGAPVAATVDYVPGRGQAVAWLRFAQDPASATVSVAGWSEP
ncbi:MAG: hypothetical protein REJ23_09705 [Brevundimonas sp.]|nr:hypothetical protein [Brevundimonas sp.]